MLTQSQLSPGSRKERRFLIKLVDKPIQVYLKKRDGDYANNAEYNQWRECD